MTRVISLIAGALLATVLTQPPAAADAAVAIPDDAFRACLNGALGGLPPNAPITDVQLATLQYVTCRPSQIQDLTGAEHLVNAQALLLPNNVVSDLTPIGGLAALNYLDVDRNQVTDLAPLAGATGLGTVLLRGNPLSQHLDTLGDLPLLWHADLAQTGLSDVTPLADATQLTWLDLDSNGITTLAPLAGLTGLQSLVVRFNQISDLSPVLGMTGLHTLLFSGNQVADLSPISGLTHLQSIEAISNDISDVSLFAALPELTWLNVRGNHISDLSPLSGNDFLTTAACSGGGAGLCAIEQTLVLPDAAVDSPYPVDMVDRTGLTLPISPASGVAYDGSALTYSQLGTFTSWWSQDDAAGNRIFSGALTQTATRPPLSGPAPSVSGTPTVGGQLTATSGSWSPAPVTVAFQWYRGATAVTGATASTYAVTAADLGQRLHVQLTATKGGYPMVSADSAETAVVARGALIKTPTPTVTGKPLVGKTLRAVPGDWQPSPVTLTYQWFRDGKAIKGAVARGHLLRKVDRGHRLTVRVTGTKAGYVAVARTSKRTAVVR